MLYFQGLVSIERDSSWLFHMGVALQYSATIPIPLVAKVIHLASCLKIDKIYEQIDVIFKKLFEQTPR